MTVAGAVGVASLSLAVEAQVLGGGPAPLEGTSMAGLTQVAGRTEPWTARFQVPAGANGSAASIEITFPPGFEVPLDVQCTYVDHGSVAASVLGRTVTCSLGSHTVPAGEAVQFQLASPRNPTHAQVTPPFLVRVLDAIGQAVAQDGDSTAVIQPGTLAALQASAREATAGSNDIWTVSFRTENAIGEANAPGSIFIDWPPEFHVEPETSTRCSVAVGGEPMPGVQTTGDAAQGQVVCLLSQVVEAGREVRATLNFVRNPPAEQATPSTPLVVLTRAASGEVHDLGSTTGASIAAHPFTSGPAQSSPSRAAGAANEHGFTFTLYNPWPADGRILLVFPSGFTFGRGATTRVEFVSHGMGTFSTVQIAGTQVVAVRSGDGAALPLGSVVHVRVTAVANPPGGGTTGPFTVATQTRTGISIDRGAAPGVAIDGPTSAGPSGGSGDSGPAGPSAPGVGSPGGAPPASPPSARGGTQVPSSGPPTPTPSDGQGASAWGAVGAAFASTVAAALLARRLGRARGGVP